MALDGYRNTSSGSSWSIKLSGSGFYPLYTPPDPNVSVAEQEELQDQIKVLREIGELRKAKAAISEHILSTYSDEDLLLIAETAAEILERRHGDVPPTS